MQSMNNSWLLGLRKGACALDAQENLAPVHPEANQPEDRKHSNRLDDWPVRLAKQVRAEAGLPNRIRPRFGSQRLVAPVEVRCQRTADPAPPASQYLRHAVHGDGVHADDNEWKCPNAKANDIDDQVEAGQYPKHPAGAEDGPARSPNAFNAGAN